MKMQYIAPVTELVVVNLQDSFLEDVGTGDPSDVAGDMGANERTFDIEEDLDDISTSRSLWDD